MTWQQDFGNPPGGYKGEFSAGDPVPAPTAAAGANAGTAPPAPVVTAGSQDLRGVITFGTGTTPAAGAQVVVTFANALTQTPGVEITEYNAATSPLNPYITGVSATGFTIATAAAPAAGQANTVYSVGYAVNP